MGNVYFVRHGQTLWNVEHKVCGATDIPLTEQGHDQAVQIGKAILDAGIRADEILYSPLSRAADTARHISAITGIPIREEPRLIEQNFGKYESTCKDNEAFWLDRQQFANHYGCGESILQVGQRIYNLLDELKAESDRKTVILVAHNGIARVVHTYFHDVTNEGYANFSLKNCEIMKYTF